MNPVSVDVAIERWQQFTGANAVLADTGETFTDLQAKGLAARTRRWPAKGSSIGRSPG